MFEPPGGYALDDAAVQALLQARHGDPFAVLGPHQTRRGRIVRAFLPGAQQVEAFSRSGDFLGLLEERQAEGLFAGSAGGDEDYVLRIAWPDSVQVTEDPYSFGPLLGDLDLYLLTEGAHRDLAGCLGAHVEQQGKISGVRFAVWAPNAHRVSVIGDFNSWDKRRNPMRLRHGAGVWEIFIPRIGAGERYKFAILGGNGVEVPDKADPVARQTSGVGDTSSRVAAPLAHVWRDQDWMARRTSQQGIDAPISIYEAHLPSWKHMHGESATWRMAIEKLVPYVASLGFTHIELLPIMEHPFRGSWGYQPLSMFAPGADLGPPEDFAAFVDASHQAGIGVLLDWVPAHFPDDPHGLAFFDGEHLYEYGDRTMARHPDWNTCIYDYGRREVRNFLSASALYWLKEFHIDGLRVDAVASMLYRDYSRGAGQWTPNIYGGRENFEAISLLQQINSWVAEDCPGAITIAEESTSWPGVTRRADDGGLGFNYKWNMGWMNDTLRYMARDPIHRCWHHDEMTFGMMYAHSEHFILPLSHDEVVHEKCSLAGKMPGDDWQKLATLRAYLAYMWSHPGKKLLFMGGEFGQWTEWNHDGELDWRLYEMPAHGGLALLMHRLNHIYCNEPAMHADQDAGSFRWRVVDDHAQSVFAFERLAPDREPLLAVFNFTPAPRHDYRIGVEEAGEWEEILNTDAAVFGGTNMGNTGKVNSTAETFGEYTNTISLTLPPLAALYLRRRKTIHDSQITATV